MTPSPPAERRDRWRAWVRPRLAVLAALLLLATLGGRLGGWWWRFDLLSHFAAQYVVVSGLLLALSGWARARYGLALAAISLAINGWLIAPLYIAGAAEPQPMALQPSAPGSALSQSTALGSAEPQLVASGSAEPQPVASGSAEVQPVVSGSVEPRPVASGAAESQAEGEHAELRVCSFNVQGANTHYEATMAYLRQVPCDLLYVLEVRWRWRSALDTLRPHYRVETAEVRSDNFGIALLSRRLRTQSRLVRPTEEDISFIETRVTVGGRAWNILGVHPVPPVAAHVARERDRSLDFIADWAGRQQGPTVVLGDFNLTPYSVLFSRLLERGKLINSQNGYGIQPTWPDHPWFLAPGRIPIDHALHNAEVVTQARSVGKAMGSDHRPIFVTLRAASL